jgi:hypothetical protein
MGHRGLRLSWGSLWVFNQSGPRAPEFLARTADTGASVAAARASSSAAGRADLARRGIVSEQSRLGYTRRAQAIKQHTTPAARLAVAQHLHLPERVQEAVANPKRRRAWHRL